MARLRASIVRRCRRWTGRSGLALRSPANTLAAEASPPAGSARSTTPMAASSDRPASRSAMTFEIRMTSASS